MDPEYNKLKHIPSYRTARRWRFPFAKLPATGKLHFAELPSRSTPIVAAYRGPCSILSPKMSFNSESEFAVSNALLFSQLSSEYGLFEKLSNLMSRKQQPENLSSSVSCEISYNTKPDQRLAKLSYSLATLLEDEIVVKDAQCSDSRHPKYQHRRKLPPETHFPRL